MYTDPLIDYARFMESRKLFRIAEIILSHTLVNLARFQSYVRVVQARLNPYKYLMNLSINQIDDRGSTPE